MRWLAVVVLLLAAPAAGQTPEVLRLVSPDGTMAAGVEVARHRGFAAVPFRSLERLGWGVAVLSDGGEARRAPHRVRLREGTPFFHWNDQLLQLAQAPYRVGDELWVPVQLLADFLPQRMPDDYGFESAQLAVRAKQPGAWVMPPDVAGAAQRMPAPPVAVVDSVPPVPVRPSVAPAGPPPKPDPALALDRTARPVVVIDPGHGGRDPGARGPGGTREKDIALAIGLALARELERRGDVDVHLTRATDRQVPLWERGEWATGIKGDRPGLFISIHANSGGELAARGFESYFLSEARTEHERRVAALENAPFRAAASDDPAGPDPALDFILKDLGNLDHQHWSALLAELVQEAVEPIHAGPNRGVKQAPLAVITNALMPAVLVEVGFISNRNEERLLASREFQAGAARALADAVGEFFERYPPGFGDDPR